MNTIWSDYVQGIKTLYLSRKLRFDDIFFDQYKTLFDIDTERNLNILEIGCGPGALATSLHRWYPNAEITAIDRDSNFITYAKSSAPKINFLEGDAEKLPFCDCAFDITISNTVSEHIEPSKFFGEQMRVLKPGGICLVLSSRRGITSKAECLEMSDTEKKFWQKAESEYDTTYDKYSICKYPMKVRIQKYTQRICAYRPYPRRPEVFGEHGSRHDKRRQIHLYRSRRRGGPLQQEHKCR